ncbi:hypothetical protein CEXT_140421 [Caerostris extrusa]|uniref:Uncharacterized protein n=1 Tax=Caerostris extrusa TaxID=172846 RepID=A0AAV4XJD7_CAEEX|nr:hypothetical protein CEXT_140421 [Caerostris extrusa]
MEYLSFKVFGEEDCSGSKMAPEDSNPILCPIMDENNPSLVERFSSKKMSGDSPPKAICVFFTFPNRVTSPPFSVGKTKWRK